MITVVCVRTGEKYGIEYVAALRDMVSKHLPRRHRFVCLTDQPERIGGVSFLSIGGYGLEGWFAKMLVFNRAFVGDGKILYIDLDMVIAGSLEPLADLNIDFGICKNFTRIRQEKEGNVTWPCLFGSCVMLLGAGFGQHVWDEFKRDRLGYIERAGNKGDQQIIQWINPSSLYLQLILPPGYLLHYKDFTDTPDDSAAILVFAGKSKPANCQIEWIRNHWPAP